MVVPGTKIKLTNGLIRDSSYKVVIVTELNNYDIRYCFQHEFGEHKSELCENFKTLVCQIVRVPIATENVDRECEWEKTSYLK